MFARLMGLKTISPDRLHQLVQSLEPVTIIDVNSRRSWMEARVPGASNLDPAAYKESDLPPDKNAVLVFYCSNPKDSGRTMTTHTRGRRVWELNR